MGFALQVIEDLKGIKDTVSNSCQMEEACKAWHSYAPTSVYDKKAPDAGV
jgi:hypothetical protein